MDDGVSQYRRKFIGYVARNKDLNSDIIEVVDPENFSFLHGEATDNVTEVKGGGTNSKGQTYESLLKTTSSIQAKWQPGNNSNRITPPDVRRGDRVQIYQFSDSDNYYWETLGNEFKKLETVTYVFSGTTDESATSPNPDNSYYFEVSTHRGVVTLSTSNKNGEANKFLIQVDGRNGRVLIESDNGNHILMDAKAHHVQVKTKLLEVLAPQSIFRGNVKIEGDLNVVGNIHATGTIIDDSGNTNHHSH